MNLFLSDDFLLQEYPEHITNTIRSGHATCLRFSRNGDFLASGRVDGTVVVWDIDTMGVSCKLRGHSQSVSSLSWSRCGRYLLSACQGWKAVLWDLASGRKHREVRFNGPIYIAELHPFVWTHFVVSIFENDALLVDVTDEIGVKHVLPSGPKRPDSDDASQRDKWSKEDGKQMTTTTIYSDSGAHILSATNKGWINIIDAGSLTVIFSRKAAAGVITTMRLNHTGRILLVNSQDRIIRSLHMPKLDSPDLDPDTIQLTEEHKFQDVVNRLSWNHIALSPETAEYVAASTYNNHELYIWERTHGSLVRLLEGPKEEQGMIEWHPHRAMVVACGLETGRVNIWSVTSPQKWSALAPDFVEVDDNEVYVEREDEFDIHPQEVIAKRRLEDEDDEVDVLSRRMLTREFGPEPCYPAGTPPPTTGEFRMPILYNLGESDSEEEFVTVSTGTMRRRSPGDGQGVDAETKNGTKNVKANGRAAAAPKKAARGSKARKR